MKHNYHLRLIILFFVAVFIFPAKLTAQAPNQNTVTTIDFEHESEDFWASINFIKLKNEIGQSLHISGSELDIFDQHLQSFIGDDRRNFFGSAPYGGIL